MITRLRRQGYLTASARDRALDCGGGKSRVLVARVYNEFMREITPKDEAMNEKPAKAPGAKPEQAKPKGTGTSLKQALERKQPASGWPDRAAGHRPDGKGKVRRKGWAR